LEKRRLHIPFTRGADTKAHPFVLELPDLLVCQNGLFSEPGAINKRTGHTAIGTSIASGGDLSAIANDNALGGGTLTGIRGLATRADELIAFGENSLDAGVPRVFSWSKSAAKWIDRGHYEGVKLDQKTVSSNPAEQVSWDRAEYISGDTHVILYTWTEYDGGTGTVHLRLYDGHTGAALSDVVDLGANTQWARAINVGTKLHVWFVASSDLIKVKVIDPTNVAGTIGDAATTFVDTNQAGAAYDIVKRGSTQALLVYHFENSGPADHYQIAIVNESGTSVSTVTKSQSAKTGGSPITLAYQATADRVAVFRVSAADDKVYGDIINGSTLADVTMNTLVVDTATTAWQRLTCAWREIADGDGFYKCILFARYSSAAGLASSSTFVIVSRYLRNDAGTGTIAGPSGSTFWSVQADIGSKAFARGSKVYFYLRFDQQQNTHQFTYILYREDGLVVARPIGWNAAFEGNGFWLPQVEELASDRFTAMLPYRNKMTADRTQVLYSDINGKEVTVDFASSLPYRGVQLGKALYMFGGYTAMYDGQGVVEQNFLVAPAKLASASTSSTGGFLTNGTRTYKVYWVWRNAQGEVERSTFIDAFTITLAHGTATQKVTFNVPSLVHTMKLGTRELPNIEIYRNVNSGGAVYFLITSLDPTNTSANNGHLVTDLDRDYITTWSDILSDTDLVSRLPDYLNVAADGTTELDNLCAEASSCVFGHGQGRIFAAGYEDENKVRYSKIWQTDDIVAFNDANEIPFPQDGGRLVAIAPHDGGVIGFKRDRIYNTNGIGPNNRGQGAYEEPQLLAADTGCSDARTLVQVPGGWVFQSPKGFRLFTSGLQMKDIGAPVADYATAEYVAAIPVPGQNLVLFVAATGGTALAYDYYADAWSTWTNPVGVAAVLWGGGYVYATSTGVFKSDTSVYTDNTSAYTLVVETPWIKFGGINGFGRCNELQILGQHKASHFLRVRIAYDYVDTWVDDRQWTPDTARYQMRHGLKRPKCSAFKARFEDVANVGTLGNSAALVGMSLKLGIKPGLSRQPGSRSQ
jgi:hypothetical protein